VQHRHTQPLNNVSLMGYGQSPWIFKGRALYQLQLVKADEVSVAAGPATSYMPQRPIKLQLQLLLKAQIGQVLCCTAASSIIAGPFNSVKQGSPAAQCQPAIVTKSKLWLCATCTFILQARKYVPEELKLVEFFG
jgi:hypothetical protein